MGRRSESTEFLKECMADALLCLMREKPFAKITADEICARAGVGRATWFRQFSSKEDALAFKVRVLWCEWLKENGVQFKTRPSADIGLCFFSFFYDSRETFETIYSSGVHQVFFDVLQRCLLGGESASEGAPYANCFVAGGLLGIVDMWIRQGFQESPCEIHQMTHEVFGRIA